MTSHCQKKIEIFWPQVRAMPSFFVLRSMGKILYGKHGFFLQYLKWPLGKENYLTAILAVEYPVLRIHSLVDIPLWKAKMEIHIKEIKINTTIPLKSRGLILVELIKNPWWEKRLLTASFFGWAGRGWFPSRSTKTSFDNLPLLKKKTLPLANGLWTKIVL